MTWITIDVALAKHPKLAELPNDSARYGWIVTLCEAKTQRRPGTFASDRHFREVLGRYARFLQDYIGARLLERDEDGALHVHDWRRHQWAVAKARHRDDNNETSGGQEEDASRAVPVPVYVSSTEEGVQGEEPDAAVEFQRRTGQFPGPKILDWLNELAEAHGEGRLVKAIASTPMAGLKVPDYLRAVRDRLRSEDHLAEKAEAADEQRRLAEKRRPIQVVPLAEDVSPEEARRLAEEHMAKYPSGRSA